MNPYWIRTERLRLAIIPRPRGRDWLPDDISLLKRAGVDVIVSALTAAENEELGVNRREKVLPKRRYRVSAISNRRQVRSHFVSRI